MGTLPIKSDRRRPEQTIVYRPMAENMKIFFAAVESLPKRRVFPRLVRKEFEGYLKCGIQDQGFLELVYDDCQNSSRRIFPQNEQK